MANEIKGLVNITTGAQVPDADAHYVRQGTAGIPVAETLYGVKTFNSFPVGPSAAPSSNYEFANKKYVDDNMGGGGMWTKSLAVISTVTSGDTLNPAALPLGGTWVLSSSLVIVDNTLPTPVSLFTLAKGGMLTAFGSDTQTGNQENGFRINTLTDLDTNFTSAIAGVDKWQLGTWRGEASEFWYMTNVPAQKDVLVATESGRVGINRQSNVMNYHAYYRGTAGVGYNDMVVGGTYTGEAQVWYNFQIQTDTNTFKWRKSIDNRVNWLSFSSALPVSLTPTVIESGITVAFEHATGHTSANAWEIIAYPQAPQAVLSVAPMRFEEILTTSDYSGTVHNDYTAELSNYPDDINTGVTLLDIGSTTAAFYVGGLTKYRSIFINLKTAAASPSTICLLLADYWNGSAWVPLTITDGTEGLIGPQRVTMRGSGVVSWTKPADWALHQLEGEGSAYTLFWVRFRVSTTNLTTAPTARCITRNGDKILAAYCSALDYEPSFHVNCLGNTVIGNSNGASTKMLTVSDVLNPTSMAGGNGMFVNFTAGGGIYMKGGACEGKFESFSNIIQIGAMTVHPMSLWSNNQERMMFPGTYFGTDTLQTVAQVVATRTATNSYTKQAMADGFGSALTFVIEGSASVRNTVALIGSVRAGADNTGDFVIQTASAGTLTERMRVKYDGNILMGASNMNALVPLGSAQTPTTSGRKGDFGYYAGYLYLWVDTAVVIRIGATGLETTW